jgi:hypothetical protein
MSCSTAYELAERSHEVFSAILIKILYPLPRRSPDHALGCEYPGEWLWATPRSGLTLLPGEPKVLCK